MGIFVGEISEISPNTLSKVAPKTTLVEKNGEISPIYEHNVFEKHINLITLGGGLLENKHVPYEGLVIETSNAQHSMFSFKTQPL